MYVIVGSKLKIIKKKNKEINQLTVYRFCHLLQHIFMYVLHICTINFAFKWCAFGQIFFASFFSTEMKKKKQNIVQQFITNNQSHYLIEFLLSDDNRQDTHIWKQYNGWLVGWLGADCLIDFHIVLHKSTD